jgi:hypothetical protein
MLFIKVTYHHIVWLSFFSFLISHCNSLGIYWWNFSIDVYQYIQGWETLSVKVIVIYWQKFFISFSFCICQFSSSICSPMSFLSELIVSWSELNLTFCHLFWYSHQAIWILLYGCWQSKLLINKYLLMHIGFLLIPGSIYIKKLFTL